MRPPPAGAIAPATTGSVSLGTMMCVPREGRMTGTSASSCSSSGRSRSAQTPVALTTFSARISISSPLSRSTARAAAIVSSPVTSTRLAVTAPKRAASASTVSTSRTSSVWQS